MVGLARNQRLRQLIGPQMWEATEQWNRTAERRRECLPNLVSRRPPHLIARGAGREMRTFSGKENPRFVVTSLTVRAMGSAGSI